MTGGEGPARTDRPTRRGRPDRLTRRGPVALLAVLGAGGLLAAGFRPWVSGRVEDAVLGGSRVVATGAEVAPGLSALALAMAAAAVAVVATGRVARAVSLVLWAGCLAVAAALTGRVLLEEHTPGTLGVPAAILTEPYSDAMDAMVRYLDHVDYRGFANADYKRDPRTGEHVFFEVNPRIGRNNWYVTASGANPADFVAADLDGEDIAPVRSTAEVLYSVVPLRLLTRYLPDAALRARVLAAAKRGIARPLHNPADGSLARRLTIAAMTMNYRRKYREFYPRHTPTGH